MSLPSIISGIKRLRLGFRGFLAIQTMLLSAPTKAEIERLAEILLEIQPDEVQLNLPTRAVPCEFSIESRGNEVGFDGDFRKLKVISFKELEKIKQSLVKLTDLPVQITTNAVRHK
jgi:wyosine [tRNA(Phe)-imidazoG37] synthetase (radical SAM superfamily)